MNIQVDVIKWIIRFNNERTKSSCELKINYVPQFELDDYHICVILSHLKDSVQLVGPIKTNFTKYYYSKK